MTNLSPLEWVGLVILALLFVGIIMEIRRETREPYSTLNPYTSTGTVCDEKFTQKYATIPTDYQSVKMLSIGPGVERDVYLKDRQKEEVTNQWGEIVPQAYVEGV